MSVEKKETSIKNMSFDQLILEWNEAIDKLNNSKTVLEISK